MPLPSSLATGAQLQDFSLFMLSRMWRWEFIVLTPQSRARSLLHAELKAALGAEFRAEQDDCAAGDVPDEDAGTRTALWLELQALGDRGEEALRDAMLFDVDQSLRQRLRGVMPQPPAADPVRQLLLLRCAIEQDPELWSGLRWVRGDPALALAVGADLPAHSIPASYLHAMQRRAPVIVPGASLPAAHLLDGAWLTRVSTKP